MESNRLRGLHHGTVDADQEAGESPPIHHGGVSKVPPSDSMLQEGRELAKSEQGSYGPLTLRLMAVSSATG